MQTNPRSRVVSASLRVLVFVLVAASGLTFASATARADGVAGAEVDPPFPKAFRDRQTSWARWEIKEDVLAAARATASPQMRDQLVSVLVTAHAYRASGYDRLRAAVCTGNETMSADRVRACSSLPAGLEDGWRRRDRIETWVVGGVVTAAYVGAIAATIVERDGDTGRGIATAAGVPMGALVGVIVVSVAARPVLASDAKGSSYSTGQKILAASVVVGGAIAGGVLGGWVARSLADSPGARVTVTAVALAPAYLTTLVMIDW